MLIVLSLLKKMTLYLSILSHTYYTVYVLIFIFKLTLQ